MSIDPLQSGAPVIITIDGPAGTGKSTVAHRLARRLGLEFLDTGAMYRAAALLAIERGIDPTEGESLAVAVRESDMHFDWEQDPPSLMVAGTVVGDRIRDADVAAIVSRVAAQPALRGALVEHQRRIARKHPRLVSEGRDQGSVVFPDASVRFYIDADPLVRAERRVAQLRAAGREVDEDRIAREIMDRDHLDASREVGPLQCPEGAIVIDTGSLSADEVVDQMESLSRRRLAIPGAETAS